MKLSDVIPAAQYAIVDGAESLWDCYPDARLVDFSTKYGGAQAYFSTVDQTVYEIQVSGNDAQTTYRWIDPDYIAAYKAESTERGFNPSLIYSDGTEDRFADTDCGDDILTKLRAIMAGQQFDTNVIMTLDLDVDLIAELALCAHKRDMKLNEFLVEVLQTAIDHGI